jgi:hypothetical protein
LLESGFVDRAEENDKVPFANVLASNAQVGFSELHHRASQFRLP